MEIFYLNMI